MSYKNNKFKVLAPTWNKKFELPKRSYFVLDIQDYFDYIIRKHETVNDNPPIRIWECKIEKTIPFKNKTRYYSDVLTTPTMKINMDENISKNAKGIY